MAARDQFKFPKEEARLDTLYQVLKDTNKRPFIGVTQGGSSRKNSGCKPAATDGRWRPTTKEKF